MTNRTAAQYNAFAKVYDRYFADKQEALLHGQPLAPEAEALLAALPPKATVLDCACGTGRLVLALAQRGFRAYGTDISAGEIALARHYAREIGLPARFAVVGWAELPRKLHRTFNLVFCVGNAICHCRDERETVVALRGIYEILKSGGALYLDSRCWETYRQRRLRFDAFLHPKQVGDMHLTWLNVRHYPRRFTDVHLTEVVILSERDGIASVESYPITFYPFRVSDLKRRLRAVGFTQVRITYRDDNTWYLCTAVKPSL